MRGGLAAFPSASTSGGLASVTGFPVVFHLQVLPAFFSLALVSCVAVGVTALPGYLVARVPPSAVSPAH